MVDVLHSGLTKVWVSWKSSGKNNAEMEEDNNKPARLLFNLEEKAKSHGNRRDG